MGKSQAEPGTPKWLCNRQKSRQLQKLRWYCQMCQKSCRDENGFKCHIQSESHHRQLELFNQSPDAFMDEYSKEFLEGYMTLMRRQYSSKRVHANYVYREFIADRHHIHMNATIWETLTNFVHFLGKSKLCKVEDTEKGWYITLIEKDPWTLKQAKKREKETKDDQEREQEFIEQQVEKGKDSGVVGLGFKRPRSTTLRRKNSDEKIQLDLRLRKSASGIGIGVGGVGGDVSGSGAGGQKSLAPPEDDVVKKVFKVPKKEKEQIYLSVEDVKDRLSVLEELVAKDPHNVSNVDELKQQLSFLEMMIAKEKKKMLKRQAEALEKNEGEDEDTEEEEEEKPAKEARTEHWIRPGIVVKVMAKNLGDKYYKQKGYVLDLTNRFTAVVVMHHTDAKIKLDQTYLQTVVPNIGRKVQVLNGRRKGAKAVLRAIDRQNYSGTVEIQSGQGRGEIFDLPYEDFSKLHATPAEVAASATSTTAELAAASSKRASATSTSASTSSK